MFEQRFLVVLAMSLGVIALTVATLAVLETRGARSDAPGCGLDPIPETGLSVLRCEDPFDAGRSLVWAVWTHKGHCVTESGALPGPWRFACENGVRFQLERAYDGTWKSCGVSWQEDVRPDLSSPCGLER